MLLLESQDTLELLVGHSLCQSIFGIEIGQKFICYNCKTIHIEPSNPVKFNMMCHLCGCIARKEGE